MNTYFIVKVSKNKDGVIKKVKLTFFLDLPYLNEYSVETIVEKIQKGDSFYTSVKNEKGIYVLGQKVHIFNDRFIRTDSNSMDKDNLDNLPLF